MVGNIAHPTLAWPYGPLSSYRHDFVKRAFCADPTFTALAEISRWVPGALVPVRPGAWGGLGGWDGLRAKDA